MHAQTNAVIRQEVTVPNKNTKKMPNVHEIPAQATKTPRIDGSLAKKIRD